MRTRNDDLLQTVPTKNRRGDADDGLRICGGVGESQFKLKNLEIPFGDTTYAYGVTSKSGGIDIYRAAGMEPAGEWIYSSRLAPFDEDVTPWAAHHDIEWQWDCAGFHFGACRWKNQNWRVEDYMIPYWSITIPLTLLSASCRRQIAAVNTDFRFFTLGHDHRSMPSRKRFGKQSLSSVHTDPARTLKFAFSRHRPDSRRLDRPKRLLFAHRQRKTVGGLNRHQLAN